MEPLPAQSGYNMIDGRIVYVTYIMHDNVRSMDSRQDDNMG